MISLAHELTLTLRICMFGSPNVNFHLYFDTVVLKYLYYGIVILL